MIPLKDDNPTRTPAVVTILLIAINAAVFAFQAALPSDAGARFVADFGAFPARLLQDPFGASRGLPPAATLISSMFLHGSLLHIGGNMLYLWIFGNNIEDRLGHARFLVFYLLSGLGAHAAQIATSPDSLIPVIGASGAIAGVLGAYLILYPRARVLVLVPLGFFIRTFWVPAIVVLGLWFALQFLGGLPSLGRGGGGVAWFAHIGGFLTGILLLGPFLLGTGRRRPPIDG